MTAIIIVLLITILCVAKFHLKNGALNSFATAIAAIVALIIAFGFYEILGGLLLSKGVLPLKINGAIFLILFSVSFAILHVLNKTLVGSDIEFGKLVNIIASVIFGIVTGLIISGCVLVGINLASLPSKLSYKRFDNNIARGTMVPRKSFLGTDDLVANLFGWVSQGSMSGKKSFALYHPNFNNQIHLNNRLLGKKAMPVSGPKAVNIPKFGVRKKEIDGGKPYTAIRVEINGAAIDKGGATDKDGNFKFAPFQIGLICQVGDGPEKNVLYPESIDIYAADQSVQNITELGEIIWLERESFITAGGKRLVVMDIAFNIPSSVKPLLLAFKNTSITAVPALSSGEDTEEKLNKILKPKK
jgi:hypothetical protein